MNTNIFELATREKYRFPYKGMISVEDLWDLDIPELDRVYKSLNKELKTTDEESLIEIKSTNVTLNNKIEIVKYIFEVKRTEEEQRTNQMNNARQRQHILEILAKKQDESLQNMSEEELLKKLEELN